MRILTRLPSNGANGLTVLDDISSTRRSTTHLAIVVLRDQDDRGGSDGWATGKLLIQHIELVTDGVDRLAVHEILHRIYCARTGQLALPTEMEECE